MVPTWNCSQQAMCIILCNQVVGSAKRHWCYFFPPLVSFSVFWSHFFPPVRRLTKALPHPSTSRTCSPAATTVSGCVLSGSARTPPSWAAPTAPQWPSPRSEMKWRWAAARPAPGPGPAPSPTEPGEAWQTSSALSSSSWFSPSSPFSSLSSSSTLSLNEQFAPPSCRVIALFSPHPPCCFVFFVLYLIVFRCQQSNRIRHVEVQWEEGLVIESWIEVKNWKNLLWHLWYLPDSPAFVTLSQLCGICGSVSDFCSIMISFLCKPNSEWAGMWFILGRGSGGGMGASTHVLVDYSI